VTERGDGKGESANDDKEWDEEKFANDLESMGNAMEGGLALA